MTKLTDQLREALKTMENTMSELEKLEWDHPFPTDQSKRASVLARKATLYSNLHNQLRAASHQADVFYTRAINAHNELIEGIVEKSKILRKRY